MIYDNGRSLHSSIWFTVEIIICVTFESSNFYLSDICVGNTNAYQYGRFLVRSGQFNGIANTKETKSHQIQMLQDQYDLHCTYKIISCVI